jgi:homoserine dehydrogenase
MGLRGFGVKRFRVSIVGFGTVGQWLVRALEEHRARIGERYALSFEVVGLANRRDGFVYCKDGIHLRSALKLTVAGDSLRKLEGVSCWATALEGIKATEADVLVEVTASPAPSGEPGLSHLEEALGRGIPAVTSNKWPVALHGVRLTELARSTSTFLRAESTVMSGTPVLSTLSEGLAGSSPAAIRGVLNATANFIVSEIGRGKRYEDALAEAQRRGLAERDPSADVEGHDSAAKVMILSALVLRRQLRASEVSRRGIASIEDGALNQAVSEGLTVREVATLGPVDDGTLLGRVEPVALEDDDVLAWIDGTANAVVCEARPLGEIMIRGPGAGVELAGQGVLSDLINVALRHKHSVPTR